MKAKARPPDDDPRPARGTPQRVARQIHALGERLGALRLEFRALAPFFDEDPNTVPRNLHALHEQELGKWALALVDFASAVRVGDVPLAARYADPCLGARPVLDAIEARAPTASAIEDAPAPVERAMSGGWRDAPVAALAIAPRQRKMLAAAGLTLLGAVDEALAGLTTRVCDAGQNWMVGDSSATEAALNDFIRDWTPPPKDEAAPAPAPANGGPKPKKKRSGPKAPPIEPGSPAAANDSAAIAAREVEPTSLAEAQATFSEEEEEEEEEEEGSWRSLPLEKLDLPPGAAQALAHHAIVSVGGLADFLEEGDFRGLATSGLTFAGAAKVRAALDDWWSARGGETPPRWALADSAYDRDHVRGLADWLRRRRAGDDFPRWGKYGEFEVKLWDGQAVAVEYDPAGGRRDGPGAAGAIEFRGPISSTGYTSHSSVEPATVQGRDLVEYCAAFARKNAAEWTALKAKNERLQARAAERRQARAAGGETRKTRAARKPRAAPAADDRAAQRAVETSGPGAPCPEDEEGGDE